MISVKMKLSELNVDNGQSFNFSNCARNMALESMGAKPPVLRSTGTTIVAVTYKVFIFNLVRYLGAINLFSQCHVETKL